MDYIRSVETNFAFHSFETQICRLRGQTHFAACKLHVNAFSGGESANSLAFVSNLHEFGHNRQKYAAFESISVGSFYVNKV